MPTIKHVCDFMEQLAPSRLAEDWDNVGLLVGDPALEATKIMTCLTVTPESAQEAIETGANLIVSHHPLPFHSMKTITTEKTASRLVWQLIRAGISIYSPHTGFDSAAKGINQSLAEKFGLEKTRPLNVDLKDPDGLGSGRIGHFASAKTLEEFCGDIKSLFQLEHLQIAGDKTKPVHCVALACGSGGSFLEAAIAAGCDTFVTGETNFHTALESSARNISLVLLGHYASERFAVEQLAEQLAADFDVEVWASRKESDPLDWV